MNYRKLYSIISDSFFNRMHIRRKPKVLQLPITSKCNSMCKTCNIWHLKNKIDINPIQLGKALSDTFFDDIRYVGINGGEITLVKEWEDILNVILKMKKLQSVHIISNGLKKDAILRLLLQAKNMCLQKNVRLGFTLSVDGIGDIHDKIRGIPKAYERSRYLLNEISKNKNIYCDDFIIGCTISQNNIPYIREIDMELGKYCVPIEYHLAVPNKRIHTFNNSSDYNVLCDERSRLLATEFFYRKSKEVKDLSSKIKYYSIYYYLKRHGEGRLCNCSYLYRDVTIDENLNLYLCATASNSAGSLLDKSASYYISNGVFNQLAKENREYCNHCIHYSAVPTIKGLWIFVSQNLKNKFEWSHKYKYMVKWQKLRF